MHKHLIRSLSGILSLMSVPALAQDTTISWGAGLQFQAFDYEEFNTQGRSLNQEEGILPGARFFWRYADQRLQHQLSLDFLAGDVDYDGQTQVGIPHETDTKTRLYHLQYQLDYVLVPNQIHAILGASWNHWSREIQPSGIIIGLDESYSWPALNAGLAFPLLQTGPHSLTLSGSYLKVLEGRFTVDLSALGFGKEAIDLGAGNGIESMLHYAYTLPDYKTLELELFYRRWSFDESNSKTLNNGTRSLTFLEPRSKSQRLGLSFNLVMPF
jgi:hypothetical protein